MYRNLVGPARYLSALCPRVIRIGSARLTAARIQEAYVRPRQPKVKPKGEAEEHITTQSRPLSSRGQLDESQTGHEFMRDRPCVFDSERGNGVL